MIARVDVQEHGDKAGLNTPGGQELQAAFGGEDPSLPFFAFLDSRGKLIVNSLRPVAGKRHGENIGHPMKPEEIDWFMLTLRMGVPTLAPADARIIETYLRNQKKD